MSRSILSRTLWRVLPLSILVLVGIWLFVLQITHTSLSAEAQNRITEKTNFLGWSVEERIESVVTAFTDLADSSLTIRVLIDLDAQDRDYLRVILDAMRVENMPVDHTAILDYKGRVLIGNGPDEKDKELIVATAMAGHNWIHIDIEKNRLQIAVPIHYLNYTEGVLFAEMELANLLEELERQLPSGVQLYNIANGHRLSSTILSGSEIIDQVTATGDGDGLIKDEVAVAGTPFMLRYSEQTSEAMSEIDRLRRVLLVVLIIDLLALVVGITLASRSVAAPVQQVARQIEKRGIRNSFEPLATVGSLEVDQLVGSYNRLNELKDQLARQLSQAQSLGKMASWTNDFTTSTLRWSDEIYTILEIDPEDGEEVTYSTLLERIHPDDRKKVEDAVSQSSNGEEPLRIEYRMLFESGRIKHLESVGVTEYGPNGERLVTTGTIQDITERVKIEQAKDEFLATMSHELRTPLTVILGYCDTLGEQLNQADLTDQRESLSNIEAAGNGLLAMVSDILDLSNIEAGKFQIDERSYSFNALLNEVVQIYAVKIQDQGLQFNSHLHTEKYLLQGDDQRIRQILFNLLNNAIKFTEQGEITMRTAVKGNQLQIQIEDTGIGIQPENRSKLFKRFQQEDSSISRRYGGSGVGLYISQNLAQIMGGRISVRSEVGRGSTFTLTLPYRVTQMQDEEKLSALKSDKGQRLLSGRVLLVEDTRMIQMLVRKMVEKSGASVVTAENGQEAIERVESDHFDLILMDMQMPVMDGLEATRQIRAKGYTTPLYGVTANVMQKHRDAFREAGSDGLIGKPVDKEKLEAILRHHLSTQAE